MSLVINNNLMATNAARTLGASFGALETSTRRLSSGLRITQASDDAAGLAVRELMRADISSLQQGIRNANDAISLIQTADGALGVIDEKLIRMKELAMQASTGTYNSDQRLIIDSEYKAMAAEITRIANSTDFNGIHLLNGNLSGSHSGSGLVSSGQMKIHFGTGNDSSEDYFYIQINNASASALGLGGGGGTVGSPPYSASDMRTMLTSIRDSNSSYSSYNSALSDGVFSDLGNFEQNDFTTNSGRTFDNNSVTATWNNGSLGYLNLVQATDGSLWINRTQQAPNSIVESARRYSTGGADSISTQQLAQQALDTIDKAIVSKDTIRAHLGALQNRLENTVTVLGIQKENLQAAESRVSDVDVADEMTEFVKNQILTQSAVAMLSQANSLPRMVLSLLG